MMHGMTRQHHADGIEINRQRADGNQHIHICQAAAHAGNRAFIKRHRQPKLHDAGKGNLQPSGRHQRVRAKQHPRHAQHKRRGKGKQQPCTPMVAPKVCVFRLHFGQRGGLDGSLITRFLDDLHQLFGRGLRVVVFHLRGLARKVHAGVGNKVFFVEHFFNAAGAGLAGHAADLQIDVLGGHWASPCGLDDRAG